MITSVRVSTSAAMCARTTSSAVPRGPASASQPFPAHVDMDLGYVEGYVPVD